MSAPGLTLVLVRHGTTHQTHERRFAGGLGGANPPLDEHGRAQVEAVAAWLAPAAGEVQGLVCSPVLRTRETADILAAPLDRTPVVAPELEEMDFGRWDGMTMSEVAQQHPDDLAAWSASVDVPTGGGESIRQVSDRVVRGAERLAEEHPGEVLVAATHMMPIKVLVAHAMGVPLQSVRRMLLSPATVTVVHLGRRPALSLYNAAASSVPFTPR